MRHVLPRQRILLPTSSTRGVGRYFGAVCKALACEDEHRLGRSVTGARAFGRLYTVLATAKRSRHLRGEAKQTSGMSQTQPRQNYHPECEAGVNKQINLELYASYVYQSMAWYFDRDDVALRGFHKFFDKASAEERVHAEILMAYQNRRGGRIVLQNIKRPERDEWGSGLEAMKIALSLEKSVNQCLTDLRRLAESKGDVQFAHFLDEKYLTGQISDIKELADYITTLANVGPGLGEYMFDKDTLNG